MAPLAAALRLSTPSIDDGPGSVVHSCLVLRARSSFSLKCSQIRSALNRSLGLYCRVTRVE